MKKILIGISILNILSISLLSDNITFRENKNNRMLTEYPKANICTMNYNPVCGKLLDKYKTFGNRCTLNQSPYKFRYEGKCKSNKNNKI